MLIKHISIYYEVNFFNFLVFVQFVLLCNKLEFKLFSLINVRVCTQHRIIFGRIGKDATLVSIEFVNFVIIFALFDILSLCNLMKSNSNNLTHFFKFGDGILRPALETKSVQEDSS